jgi:four helix bundle protein
MKEHDIYPRVLDFASRVVKMNKALVKDHRVDRNAINQLVRSASSIGSNLEEARGGSSKRDFHARLRISLKEARESQSWLRLLQQSNCITENRIAPLVKEAGEIVAILTTIAKNANPDNPPAVDS